MNTEHTDIAQYLERFRSAEMRTAVAEACLRTVAVLVSGWLLIVVFDRFFPVLFAYGGLVRALFFSLFLLSALVVASRFFLWRVHSPERLAVLAERKAGMIDNLVINAVQLTARGKGYPDVFIARLRRTAGERAAAADVPSSPVRGSAKFLFAVSVLLLGAYAAVFPRQVSDACLRVFFPGSAGGILVEPGDCEVIRGGPLTIRVFMRNMASGAPSVRMKNTSSGFPSMETAGAGWSCTIPEITANDAYRVVSGAEQTRWYRITVRDRTVVRKLNVTCRYPAYMNLRDRTDERDISPISVPFGTAMTVEAVFNNAVKESRLVLGTGTVIRAAAGKPVFSFRADASTLYEIQFKDPVSGEIFSSARERLEVLPDRAPYLEFIVPAKDCAVAPGGALSVKVRASDDFGLTAFKLRLHVGPGEISDRDRVVHQVSLRGIKETVVPATFLLPAKFTERVAYYAECLDTCGFGANLGRSSVFYVYPPGFLPAAAGRRQAETKQDEQAAAAIRQLAKTLERFQEEQKKFIAAAKRLAETRDFPPEQLALLAEREKQWADSLDKMVDDLKKVGPQTKGVFTLADELVEVVSHVQEASRMTKPRDITINVSAAETGLELAKELTSNLERWLAEFPDYIKWNMEEPAKPYDVPEATLPDELEDIIGDLVEQEEDMKDSIEDVTSSWMDSLDKGAGWGVMDGPISNMSAKGVTGNVMPNQTEIGGRSGEGRTGRSYGEMVEKTATGKGGRKTPARLTPDNLEPGQVQDTAKEGSGGATGGGKLSGWGGQGLRGPVQDASFKYAELSGRQAKIIEQAEKLQRDLKVLNVYNPQLEKTLAAMKEFQVQMKEGRYTDLPSTQHIIMSNLKQAQIGLMRQTVIRMENTEATPRAKRQTKGFWDERIPAGYEDIVRRYYEGIAGR